MTRLRPGDAREETEEIEQMPGPITAPTITQKPRNSKVLEGSDGIFTVKISGNPKPKVSLYGFTSKKYKKTRLNRVSGTLISSRIPSPKLRFS